MDRKMELLIFCQNEKCLRKKNGLTLEKVARIMRVGIPTVEKVESGVFPEKLSIVSVFRLAEYFGMDLNQMFVPMQKD